MNQVWMNQQWIRSGKTWESEPVWFFSGASDMVGQWGREGGRGELAGGQLQQTFAWDKKLVAWCGQVLNLQTCQIQWNWNLKKASEYWWENNVDFWKLLLETPVAWDDTASGRPCCGTCFLSWDPKAPAFLREAFFHIQATPSLSGNCARIPAISYWQQLYH